MFEQLKKQKEYHKVKEAQKEILELKARAEEILKKMSKLMDDTGIGCSLEIKPGLSIDYKPYPTTFLNFMFPGEFKNVRQYSEKFESKVEKLLNIDPDEIYDLAEEFDFQFAYETEGWTVSSWGC